MSPTSDMCTVLDRNNVRVSGIPEGPPMLFAHGFGCDQTMWRSVAPAFEATHRVVLFDYVGAGGSDLAAYSPERYGSLDGYVEDVLDVCRELDLRDVVFVGHSVSAMVGVLASVREPELFSKLVLVGPSPRYVDDGDYLGGFSAVDIDELLESLESNWLGWSAAMAPVIAGHPESPEYGAELTNSFCRTDPEVALRFARVTFTADNRADLPQVRVPALLLQSSDDPIAPLAVGEYVHRAMPDSRFHVIRSTGHCPQLTAPEEVIAAIAGFV